MNLSKQMAAAMFERDSEKIREAYAEEWPKETKKGDEMSKSEKLTNLLCKVRKFCQEPAGKCVAGCAVISAYAAYNATPDDPPQPPEMPECVRALLDYITEIYSRHCKSHEMAKAVRDHYAKPLKLEVGKVYEDASGVQFKLYWQNKNNGGFLGVELEGGATQQYAESGRGLFGASNLIREVTP